VLSRRDKRKRRHPNDRICGSQNQNQNLCPSLFLKIPIFRQTRQLPRRRQFIGFQASWTCMQRYLPSRPSMTSGHWSMRPVRSSRTKHSEAGRSPTSLCNGAQDDRLSCLTNDASAHPYPRRSLTGHVRSSDESDRERHLLTLLHVTTAMHTFLRQGLRFTSVSAEYSEYLFVKILQKCCARCVTIRDVYLLP
jgi:hypothetical protein